MIGKGSPRIKEAAETAIKNDTGLSIYRILLSVGYDKDEAANRTRQKTLSKPIGRLRESSKSDLSSNDSEDKIPCTALTTEVSTSVASAFSSSDPSNTKKKRPRPDSSAKDTSKKPKHIRDAFIPRNTRRDSEDRLRGFQDIHDDKMRKIDAYRYGVSLAKDYMEKGLPVTEASKRASDEFNIPVCAHTLRKLIREGRETISGYGINSILDEAEFEAICTGLISYVKINQQNGGPGITRNMLKIILENLFKGKQMIII